MIFKTLILSLLFSLSILMHILSCALYRNWLPLTIGMQKITPPRKHTATCHSVRAGSRQGSDPTVARIFAY